MLPSAAIATEVEKTIIKRAIKGVPNRFIGREIRGEESPPGNDHSRVYHLENTTESPISKPKSVAA